MEQLKALLDKAKTDEELMAKLDSLGMKGSGQGTAGSNWDEYIKLAAEYGFTITADELDKIEKHGELNENDLESVSGGEYDYGRSVNCWFTPTGKKSPDELNAECGSYCGWFLNHCSCWGMPYCNDKMHVINKRSERLEPQEDWNHARKDPPSYKS